MINSVIHSLAMLLWVASFVIPPFYILSTAAGSTHRGWLTAALFCWVLISSCELLLNTRRQEIRSCNAVPPLDC